MQYKVVRPADLGQSDLKLWREFQKSDVRLQSPFLCPEFALTLARHHDNVFVSVINDGADTVGYFPFQRNHLGVATTLGFGIGDQQAVICASGTVLNGRELLERSGLSILEFDHLVAHQAREFRPPHVNYEPSPVIDITGGFDAWLTEKTKKSKGRVKNALYKKRRLQRELGPLEFTYNSDNSDDLDLMMHWKSLQYVRTGRMDRFARHRRFVQDLVKSNGGDFSTRLSVSRVAGNTLAVCLSLRAFDQLTTWFPSYDVEMSRYSPGLISILDIVEAAGADGIKLIDLGKGDEDYKESFKNVDVEVASGWIKRPAFGALVHVARRAPQYAVTDFVLDHPKLRLGARETLNRVGRLRLKIKS